MDVMTAAVAVYLFGVGLDGGCALPPYGFITEDAPGMAHGMKGNRFMNAAACPMLFAKGL